MKPLHVRVYSERPSLVRSSSEKTSRVGDTVVFECLSEPPAAAPRAQQRVDWLKDGAPLVLTDRQSLSAGRHYLIADSQLLVLVDARPSDAGLYVCDVSNAVGSRRAEYLLRVMDRSSSRDEEGVSSGGPVVTVRGVGLAVVAGVCGVVLTSVAWLVVIYWLQRRRDITDATSSTSTDETMMPAAALDCLQHHVRLMPGIHHRPLIMAAL